MKHKITHLLGRGWGWGGVGHVLPFHGRRIERLAHMKRYGDGKGMGMGMGWGMCYRDIRGTQGLANMCRDMGMGMGWGGACGTVTYNKHTRTSRHVKRYGDGDCVTVPRKENTRTIGLADMGKDKGTGRGWGWAWGGVGQGMGMGMGWGRACVFVPWGGDGDGVGWGMCYRYIRGTQGLADMWRDMGMGWGGACVTVTYNKHTRTSRQTDM